MMIVVQLFTITLKETTHYSTICNDSDDFFPLLEVSYWPLTVSN